MPKALNETDEEIFALVSKVTGVPRARLTLDTDLYGDLGVTGDDASELLITLETDKAVDLDGIRFDRHFTGEAFLCEGRWLHHGIWMLFGIVGFAVTGVLITTTFSIPYPTPEWVEYLLFAICAGWVLVWMYLGNLVLPSARKWRRERMPVTIQVLTTAAKEKKWPINYEGQAKK